MFTYLPTPFILQNYECLWGKRPCSGRIQAFVFMYTFYIIIVVVNKRDWTNFD